MPEGAAVFVGIDVSKAHLDVGVEGEPNVRRVANDEEGIEGLVSELRAMRPALVVMEATGGFEMREARASCPRPMRSMHRASHCSRPGFDRTCGSCPRKPHRSLMLWWRGAVRSSGC